MFHRVFSRPRFFMGRLLTAQDLQAEQAYHRDKSRFRNLHLYGTGLISGLHVQLGHDGSSIIITPGYAVDRFGNDICVPCQVPITVPPQATDLSCWIRYAEMEATPMPGLSSPNEDEPLLMNSELEEGFQVDLVPIPARRRGQQLVLAPPADHPDAWLLLGLLLRKGKGWRLKPNRQRSHASLVKERSTRKNRS